MSDNIASRLYEYARYDDILIAGLGRVVKDIGDAADEIVRLRSLVVGLKQAIEIQVEYHTQPIATTQWYANHAKSSLDWYRIKGGWEGKDDE